jgi:hypothetical protein
VNTSCCYKTSEFLASVQVKVTRNEEITILRRQFFVNVVDINVKCPGMKKNN